MNMCKRLSMFSLAIILLCTSCAPSAAPMRETELPVSAPPAAPQPSTEKSLAATPEILFYVQPAPQPVELSASAELGKSYGNFPEEPVLGAQILDLSINGAVLGIPWEQKDGGRHIRNYDILSFGNQVTLSANAVTGKKVPSLAVLSARLGVKGQEKATKGTYNRKTPDETWIKPFTLTVDIPAGTKSIGFAIELLAMDNQTGEQIFIVLQGVSKAGTPPDAPIPSQLLGKLPCREALKKFNLTDTPTAITMDYPELMAQMDDAIKRYEKETGEKVYVQDNVVGTLPSLTWLINQGGTADVLSKDFVFSSDADRAKYAKNHPTTSATSPPGTEVAYVNRILETSLGKGGTPKKLTVSDLTYLALKERKGNIKQAMLLAHNAFRSMSRLMARPFTGTGDQDLTLVDWNPAIPDTNIVPFVDRPPLGRKQNNGALYHFFGVVYFEMQARGTFGAYTLIQWTADESYDRMTDLVTKINKVLAKDPQLITPADQTFISELANEVEQWARVHLFGSEKDPLKYCYNVWGAQIGAWLYRQRVERRGLPSLPPSPPPGVMTPTMFGPVTLPLDPRRPIRTVTDSSPLTITWSGGGDKMILDQKTGNLWGYFPVEVIPSYEEETKTYSITWIELTDAPYEVTLEATQTGWAHLSRFNEAPAYTYLYPIPIKAGERFTLQMDNSAPNAAIKRSGGAAITPMTFAAKGKTASVSVTPPPAARASSTPTRAPTLPATLTPPPAARTCDTLINGDVRWETRLKNGGYEETLDYPSGAKEIIASFFFLCMPNNVTITTKFYQDGELLVSQDAQAKASSEPGTFRRVFTRKDGSAFADGLYEIEFYLGKKLLGSSEIWIGF